MDNHCQFIGVGRIVANAVRYRTGQQVTVPILVLQALAIQCGASSCRPDEKSTRLTVASRPSQIPNTLKTKHGVKNVERHHRIRTGAVRRGCGQPGGKCARLVNALLQNLPLDVLFVIHHLSGILWRVALAYRRINTELSKHTFHAKCTRFVRHDWHHSLPNIGVLYQTGKHTHKGHRGRNFSRTTALKLIAESRQRWCLE